MHIQTSRLNIRSLSVSDIPTYAGIVADPCVTRFLGNGLPHAAEVAASYIRDCIARETATGISRYGVHVNESDRLIGFCGFKEDSGSVDFGWRYAKTYWGKGYATEAATAVFEYGIRVLGLSGIVAVTFEENLASVRIINKLGFMLTERTTLDGKSFLRFAQPEDMTRRRSQPIP